MAYGPDFYDIQGVLPKEALKWAMPPVRLGLSGRNSGKIPERPRKRSHSVSWNSPREYGWGAPKPYNSRHLRRPEHFQNSLPPSTAGTPLFSEVVLERASQSRSWDSQLYWGHFRKKIGPIGAPAAPSMSQKKRFWALAADCFFENAYVCTL